MTKNLSFIFIDVYFIIFLVKKKLFKLIKNAESWFTRRQVGFLV